MLRLPDGSLMDITKVYPLDAVFDTLDDVPEDVSIAIYCACIAFCNGFYVFFSINFFNAFYVMIFQYN